MANSERRALLAAHDPNSSPLVELGYRIGPDNLNAVLEVLGGERHYIPPAEAFWEALERPMRNAMVIAKYRGNNLTELSEETGLTTRHIRRIVADEKSDMPAKTCPRSA